MSILDTLNVDAVRNVYTVANTPTFLVKQLKGLPDVVALGRHTPRELVAMNERGRRQGQRD